MMRSTYPYRLNIRPEGLWQSNAVHFTSRAVAQIAAVDMRQSVQAVASLECILYFEIVCTAGRPIEVSTIPVVLPLANLSPC